MRTSHLFLSITLLINIIGTQAQTNRNLLWYDEPAQLWTEALPIGNGRLGGMVYGGVIDDRIQLNEETIWSGGPYEPELLGKGAEALPEIRQLVYEGKFREAQKVFYDAMETKPQHHQKYQTLGSLHLKFFGFGDLTDHGSQLWKYRRELDIDSAIVRVSVTIGDVTYTREYFSSPVDDVMIMRLTASQPGRISFEAHLAGKKNPQYPGDEYFMSEAPQANTLILRGRNASHEGVKGQVEYQCRVKINTSGGLVHAVDDRVRVSNADEVMIVISAATNFVNYNDVSADPEKRVLAHLENIRDKSYTDLKKDHVAEHSRLMKRVNLSFGRTWKEDLPTDERIKRYKEGDDPNLVALFFQYGRYLLISSSRPGTQPPSLQGIWNESMNPAWGGKYTTNINLEMNYWPVDVTNLAECFGPLYEFIEDLAETGSRTAKLHYGVNGWVHHFNTDIWRPTAPMGWDGYFGTWHAAGGWFASHLWEHYLFTNDREYLEKAYPLIKGSAQFFLESMVVHPEKKWLITCPSSSPENWYKVGENPRTWDMQKFLDKEMTTICAGPTVDMEIIRYLFQACSDASEILDTDTEFRNKLAAASQKLAPVQIGKHGQLQEWLDDWDDPNDRHRHLSHLWGVYPGNTIILENDPGLAEAARVSLLQRGDGGTGWAMAWKLGLWSRLKDPVHVKILLDNIFNPEGEHSSKTGYTGGVLPNLFVDHPPFQIDGNFGGTASIAEILLQSHNKEIELLPALPENLHTGEVKGLVARGGFEVDIKWEGGKLTESVIHSNKDGSCSIRYLGKTVRINVKMGSKYKLNRRLKLVQ